jgi:hypothetical protein
MANRPGHLADRISNRRKPDNDFPRETFTLPVEAARLKAREILNQFPQGGYTTVVEHWRQLPDGQIEFTMPATVPGTSARQIVQFFCHLKRACQSRGYANSRAKAENVCSPRDFAF